MRRVLEENPGFATFAFHRLSLVPQPLLQLKILLGSRKSIFHGSYKDINHFFCRISPSGTIAQSATGTACTTDYVTVNI